MDWFWLKVLLGVVKVELSNFNFILLWNDVLVGLMKLLVFLILMLIVVGVICLCYKIINKYLDSLVVDVG